MIEFSKNQYWSSVLMFITINLLFYYRYLYRISPYVALFGTLIYVVWVVFLFRKSKAGIFSKLPDKLLWGGIVFTLAACVGVLYYIPCEILKVDRWEVIHVFWDSVSQGINPYGVRNSVGNYPGPMPVYFLIYYPFYALGEIGYSTLLAVLVWFFFFYRKYSKQALMMAAALLLSSAFLYWEIFTRSTVLINACLFCYYLLYLLKRNRFSGLDFWILAVVGGLIFSIRNVFVLPLIVWGIYMLHRKVVKWTKLVLWGGLFVLSFGITFVPFLLLWPDEFLKVNPFLIQSSVLIPFGYVLFFVGVSVCLGWIARSEADVFFYGGTVLFLMITVHVCYWIFREGLTEGYFNGRGDISYYLFAVPFLLEIIVRKNTMRIKS